MIQRPARLIAPAVAVTLLLAACSGGTGAGSVTPSATVPAGSVVPTPDATPPASETPSPAPSAEPTTDLGPFACSLPVESDGTVDRAQLADVRVGEHDGYDRVVFEFDAGIPDYTISEESPPFTMDPSGLPLEVGGSYFWQIAFNGGTKMLPDGSSSYDGPTDFTPGFTKLVQLVEGGDFEAVSGWFVGMSSSSCIRVLALDDPARLVVDIEH